MSLLNFKEFCKFCWS